MASGDFTNWAGPDSCDGNMDHIKQFNPSAVKKFKLYNSNWISNGAFADTFRYSQNRIVKITSSKADAYACAQLAKLGKKLPHLVRVYSVHKIKHVNRNLWAIKAELLREVNNAGRKEKMYSRDIRKIESALGVLGLRNYETDCTSFHNLLRDNCGRLTAFDFGFTTRKFRIPKIPEI